VRIAYVTNSLEMGGIETNLCRLTGALSRRGDSVTVCARPGTLTTAIIANGGTVWDLEMRPTSPASLFRDFRQLRSLLNQEVDLVHVFSATAALLVNLAIWTLPRSRRPVVVASLMGVQASLDERRWKTLLRARVTLTGADLVIVTSPAIGALIDELHHQPSRSVQASVVGVEVVEPPSRDQIEWLRISLELGAGDHLVTTIGRLDSTKSHHLFIQAAERILRDRNDVVFAVVGAGPLDRILREQVAEAGIDGAVHLLGERRDIADLLCASTAYVRPGIVDGFVGITVLEAQSLSRPVISFDTRDVRPAIQHDVSGLLVSPNDTEALASAIVDLIDNPVRAAAIGKAGFDQFVGTFSLDSVVENLCTIYSGAITKEPS
jgi:glycosyltransferase involved in cell wall biosynthesis